MPQRNVTDMNEWPESRIVSEMFKGAGVSEARGVSDAFSSDEIVELSMRPDLSESLQDQIFSAIDGMF